MDYKVRLIIAIVLFVIAGIARALGPRVQGEPYAGALVAFGLALVAWALYDLAPAPT